MHKRFLGGSIGRAGLVIDWIWGAVGRGVDTDNIQVFIWSVVDMVVPLTRKRILRIRTWTQDAEFHFNMFQSSTRTHLS